MAIPGVESSAEYAQRLATMSFRSIDDMKIPKLPKLVAKLRREDVVFGAESSLEKAQHIESQKFRSIDEMAIPKLLPRLRQLDMSDVTTKRPPPITDPIVLKNEVAIPGVESSAEYAQRLATMSFRSIDDMKIPKLLPRLRPLDMSDVQRPLPLPVAESQS